MKATVIGAGIGGLAVALLLRRLGWEVQILEAADGFEPTAGAFLNLADNGRAVLAELGLAERVAADGHPAATSVLWGARGQLLGAVPNGPAGQPERGGVIMRRGQLQEVLAEEVAAARLPITFSHRVGDLDEIDADVVVGADGIGSVVRGLVAPDAKRPRSTGLVGLGGFASGTGLAPTPGEQHFVFGRRSFFGYLVRTDGIAYWFANVTDPATDRDCLRAVSANAWLERLGELHRDDPAPVPQILAAAESHVGAYPIDELAGVPRWHRGRAVLLGDAAHALSPSVGQGAALALEDAETLVRCLRELPVPQAFTAYEHLRRPRTEAVAAHARAVDKRKRAPGGAIGAAIRDLMMPMFLRRAAADTSADWLYARPDGLDPAVRSGRS